MNKLSPEVLRQSRSAFTSTAMLSLADLRARVSDRGVGTTRRDMLSALDAVARRFNCDLGSCLATPKRVRVLLASKSAAQLGLSEKRYANIRSCLVAALKAHGDVPQPITKRIPLAPEWLALLDSIPKYSYRTALYRCAAYGSFMGILPNQVRCDTLIGLHDALEAEEIVKDPRRLLKHTIAHWNMCRREVPGWPDVTLSSPFKKKPISLPVSAFPQSFQDDLHRWEQRMSNPDVLDPDAPARPLRPVTVSANLEVFVRFASVLIQSSAVAIERMTALNVLVIEANYKAGLRFFLERYDNKPTPYIARIAQILLTLARKYCRLDGVEVSKLAAMRRRLEPPNARQMTPKNRGLLRQLDDPAGVARLLPIPDQERARGLHQKNPHRAAKCFERAVAFSLFMHCALRIGTLSQIDIKTDLSWAGGKCFLSIDGSRVKNGQLLEFELPDTTASLLQEYIQDHRPNLAGSDGQFLFPARNGGPRHQGVIRADFKQATRRAGLEMHPHLIRQAIAKIVVERDPGLVAAISRHLGHKTVDMTMTHYLGTESRASGRHINKLLRDAAINPAIPEDESDVKKPDLDAPAAPRRMARR